MKPQKPWGMWWKLALKCDTASAPRSWRNWEMRWEQLLCATYPRGHVKQWSYVKVRKNLGREATATGLSITWKISLHSLQAAYCVYLYACFFHTWGDEKYSNRLMTDNMQNVEFGATIWPASDNSCRCQSWSPMSSSNKSSPQNGGNGIGALHHQKGTGSIALGLFMCLVNDRGNNL